MAYTACSDIFVGTYLENRRRAGSHIQVYGEEAGPEMYH